VNAPAISRPHAQRLFRQCRASAETRKQPGPGHSDLMWGGPWLRGALSRCAVEDGLRGRRSRGRAHIAQCHLVFVAGDTSQTLIKVFFRLC